MTVLPDAPIEALAIPGTQIVLGLNLYQCQPYTVTVKGEGLLATLELGRKAAMAVNGTLARRATTDQTSFYHLRERVRRSMVAVEAGRPVRGIGSEPLRALTTAFLWLSLNEPQKGSVVRGSALRCLTEVKRVVIQIACGPEIAYATHTGVNPKDMTDLIGLAASSPVSMAFVQPPDRTVH